MLQNINPHCSFRQ